MRMYVSMRFALLIVVAFLICQPMFAQQPYFVSEKAFVEQVNLTGELPANILSTRSCVIHSHSFSAKELEQAQQYFQRSGIDAVCYFAIDVVTAGQDVKRAFIDFLQKREISNFVLMEKHSKGFRIAITSYSGKENVLEPQQSAWSVTHETYSEALKIMYRATAAAQLKKQNLLINDYPESGLMLNPIVGRRNEYFAVDLKVDPLGVLKFGDEAMDKQLEELLINNYPFKYKLFEPGTPEKEMRKQGYYYVVQFINTRASVAKDLLGYTTTKAETAQVSVTYPESTQQVLKNIPSNTPVYKAYFKHIDSQNVFLGNKWDADLSWNQALLNAIRALKAEMKIN